MASSSSSLSSDSEVSNDSGCSYKSCFENVESVKSQKNKLLEDLRIFVLMVLGYKKGLESVEERLEFFKKQV
jgi:hypothetical protein